MNKTLLITSNQLRHKYVAHIISSNLNLCGILSEKKPTTNFQINKSADSRKRILENHFYQRDKVEKEILGEIKRFPNSVRLKKIDRGQSNSEPVFEWIRNINPDLIILYGSSIIRPPLLDFYDKKIINLHLGLSPYYRGSGTNFWPLVDAVPECVGATIHLATSDVDAGNILAQVRPKKISVEDGVHNLGTKTIISGADMLCKTVTHYYQNRLVPKKQNLEIGKVYRRKDFNAEAVETMLQNFNDGMIEKYLSNKNQRDNKYPIVKPEIL